MNSMGIWNTFAVLLLFIATAEAADEHVTFWKENFTMTCPEAGNWFKEEETSVIAEQSSAYSLQYDGTNKGTYRCEYLDSDNKIKHYFFVKGKVCKNCFELSATLFGFIIAVDVVATAVMMVIIFKCTKKKSSAELTHTPKAPARSGARDPNVQSPHYEPLNTHTRTQDPYSFVNRMG